MQQDDSSRLAQLRCHTARGGHMYQKFTWGNRKSLVTQPAQRGVDVRARLVDYYKCASLKPLSHDPTVTPVSYVMSTGGARCAP